MLKSILQPVLQSMLTSVLGDSVGGATVPVAPVLGTPTVTDTTMILTWTMSNDTGVTDYIIEYKASSSGTWLVFSDGTSTAKTATITGLTGSTSYDARVKAVNAVGQSEYSNVQTISTKRLLLPTDIGALAWWDMLSGVTDSGSATVATWNDLTANARHISQASGASRPAITASGISFDGVNDYLWNTVPFMFAEANGVVIMAIVSAPTTTLNHKVLFGEGRSGVMYAVYSIISRLSGANQQKMYAYIYNDGFVNAVPSNLIVGNEIAYDDTFKLLEVKDTKTQISNKVNAFDDGTIINYTRSGAYTLNTLSVGCNFENGVIHHSAGIFKALSVFPANILESDLEKARGSLCHRHGLSSLLPIGHPYKTNPPLI